MFGLLLWVDANPPAPNGNRQARCIVAASSQKAAARAFGVSLHEFRTYGGLTGNKQELSTALKAPGVVFWQEERFSPATPRQVVWHRLEASRG